MVNWTAWFYILFLDLSIIVGWPTEDTSLYEYLFYRIGDYYFKITNCIDITSNKKEELSSVLILKLLRNMSKIAEMIKEEE